METSQEITEMMGLTNKDAKTKFKNNKMKKYS